MPGPYSVKSCGKAHAYCGVCRPEVLTRTRSPEHCAALSAAMTPELRAKISASLKGRTLSPEHRVALIGKTCSPEKRAKLSAANRTGGGNQVPCPTHPYAEKRGMVCHSHLVWEFAHHMFLPRCFWVHHIDGDHSNDDPGETWGRIRTGKVGNLALMFPTEHMRWHQWERSG